MSNIILFVYSVVSNAEQDCARRGCVFAMCFLLCREEVLEVHGSDDLRCTTGPFVCGLCGDSSLRERYPVDMECCSM